MFEMACVSLNKIKLHYNAVKKSRKARWLEFLLNNPSYLFGTTLIGVNTLMQIGSESSRRFYEAMHIPPGLAPVSQILIVLIFGELAPLFAARKHSEHVAYFSVPVIYLISRLLTPFIWVIDKISKISNLIFGKQKIESFLSKEELQKVLEEPAKSISKIDNDIISNIFNLKDKKVSQIMISINQIASVSSDMTIKEVKKMLESNYLPFIPIFHKEKNNIIAIAYPKDLLKAKDEEKLVDHAKNAWFITELVFVVDVLRQFKTNKQFVAVVLNKSGKSKGLITLDQIEDEIFGEYPVFVERKNIKSQVVIVKTLPGNMSLKKFNKEFKAKLFYKSAKTIGELIILYLNHRPSVNEIITFGNYEFTISETSLLGIEKVKVKTRTF
jgi:CBS domain containing-hemolysin-like protein